MATRRHRVLLPLALLVAVLAPTGGERSPWAFGEDADPPGPTLPPAPEDGSPAPPPVSRPFEERRAEAIANGLAWVRSQGRDGFWGRLSSSKDDLSYSGKTGVYEEPYGGTALALYTLLKCGVPLDDSVVEPAFANLRSVAGKGSAYELAMTLLAVTATAARRPAPVDPKKGAAGDSPFELREARRAWAQDLVVELVKIRAPDGWRYWGAKSDRDSGGVEDLSSTQLVTLALLEAQRCGIRVDPRVWAD